MTTADANTLNILLRGELAATETYQQAMAKAANEEWAFLLRAIHGDHREAANTLRQYVHSAGAQPDQGSGAWGVFAKAVEGTAKNFGKTAALKALKEGEEHGVRSYEDALQDEHMSAECTDLIRTRLLPQTKAHIPVLDNLMSAS
jgi:uncharacterized protein (TIGR02284 family)